MKVDAIGPWQPIYVMVSGVALGALLRWQLGLKFDSLFSALPPGPAVAKFGQLAIVPVVLKSPLQ